MSDFQRMLFHIGFVDRLRRSGGPVPFAGRLVEMQPPIRVTMAAGLESRNGAASPQTT